MPHKLSQYQCSYIEFLSYIIRLLGMHDGERISPYETPMLVPRIVSPEKLSIPMIVPHIVPSS